MRSLQRFAGPVLLGLLLGCVPLTVRKGSHDGQLVDIEGTGGDGQAMRLRDYRGKVVLLSFWHGN
jgi:hypothetical protein